MKKFLIFLILIFSLPVYATMTHTFKGKPDKDSFGGSVENGRDEYLLAAREMEDWINASPTLSDSNQVSFTNGGYISNVDNNEVKIGENGEAFSFDFDVNTVTARNKTGILVLDLLEFATTYLKTLDVCDITFDGTAITATPAELNYLAGSATETAEKAVIFDASKNIDRVNDVNAANVIARTAVILTGGTITKASSAVNQVTLPDANGYLSLSKIYTLSAGHVSIPASSCWGGTYVSYGALDTNAVLPSPVAGMSVTFVQLSTADVNITPYALPGQILAGTNAAGDSYSSAATAGDSLTIRCIDDVNWVVVSKVGTWADID